MKKILLFLLLIPFTTLSQIHNITTSSTMVGGVMEHKFLPDTLVIEVGDSVYFDLGGTHNAVEVQESIWMANGIVPSGFELGYGVDSIIINANGSSYFNTAKTYYYVCQSHVGFHNMKGVIIAQISGCDDVTACNYDPAATADDGSCIGVFGCMDNTKCNYDANATCEVQTIAGNTANCGGLVGCMDPTSCDYDASATCPSNSVTTAFCGTNWGCMTPSAVNYDPSANCDTGSYYCVIAEFSTNTICEGDPTLFTDLSSSNAVSWNWDFGDGSTSTSQSPSHTYLTCGTYSVTLDIISWVNGQSITDTYTDNVEVLCPTTPIWVDDACESYTWAANGVTYTKSTIDTSYGLNAAGCLETNILHLTIQGSSTYTNLTGPNAVCDSYTWLVTGLTYTTSGRYIDSSYNSFNCKHVDTLDLWVNASTMSIDADTSCDSYTWAVNGVTYDSSVVDTVVTVNPVGCPDTSILNLTINYSDSAYTTMTACDSYDWNGQTYTSTGLYGCCIGLQTAAGCDSVIWLDLTINSTTHNIETYTKCGSYTWPINGQTYTASDIDTVILTNAAGCDSINILNLTINYATTIDTSVTECDSYTWPISGLTYTTSEVDTLISTNAAGCVETHILHLTINNSSSTHTSIIRCDSYYWPTDFQLYDTSGIYSLIQPNNNNVGCTHTDTLALIINYSTIGTSHVTACDSFTWEGQTVYSSDTLTHTYTNGNVVGCDSTHTLMVDINYSNAGSSSDTACNIYSWNGATYNSSGTYIDTLTNINGCDSIATLDLIIYSSDTTIHGADSICNQFSWNGMTYTSSGTYTWNGTNVNGCDSTAILNLIIRNSTTSISDTVINCPDTSYLWNGTNYTSSGTYTYSTTNSVGCDSTATLNLTINGIEYNIDSFLVCEGDTVWVGNTAYTIPGFFNADTVNNNGCTSISGVSIAYYTPTPLNLITIPNPPIVCVGDTFVIEVNSGFLNYEWNTGDSSNRIEIYPTLNYTYVVEALDINGCESREEIQVVVKPADSCITSSLTDNILTQIEVYPNPSQNVFNVNFNVLQDENVQLRAINSIGEVVFTEYIKDHIGQYSTEIILDNHSKGIYLLQIITDKLIVNKKLILQ